MPREAETIRTDRAIHALRLSEHRYVPPTGRLRPSMGGSTGRRRIDAYDLADGHLRRR
jgi:hypothetical protein